MEDYNEFYSYFSLRNQEKLKHKQIKNGMNEYPKGR